MISSITTNVFHSCNTFIVLLSKFSNLIYSQKYKDSALCKVIIKFLLQVSWRNRRRPKDCDAVEPRLSEHLRERHQAVALAGCVIANFALERLANFASYYRNFSFD